MAADRSLNPDVIMAMELAERFYSALGGQLHNQNAASYTAADEDETVEVTINGHRWLSDLYIEDGLLRLGAEEVERRVNEALTKAITASQEDTAGDGDVLESGLEDIVRKMHETLGTGERF